MTDNNRSVIEIELSEEKLRREIASLTAAEIKFSLESDFIRKDLEAKDLELIVKNRFVRDEAAKSDEARILTFYGPVTQTSASGAISKLSEWYRRSPGEDIEIVFNSPGGSVIDGLALFDYIQELRRRGTKITTITMGMAASMGGVLLQAGDLRIASPNSVMLIHEVSAGSHGKVSEIEDHLKFMEVLQGKCLDILAERSIMTARQIATKWKKTDWWLSADEALKLGFVDEIR